MAAQISVSFQDLQPVRSVVQKWPEVSAEKVEQWREAVIADMIASEESGCQHWMLSPPPDVPLATGVTLSKAQARAFAAGDTADTEKMVRRFIADVFGPLVPAGGGCYFLQSQPAMPGNTQFSPRKFHRDPAPIFPMVMNALPTLFLLAHSADFPFTQTRTPQGLVTLDPKEHPADEVQKWGEDNACLIEAPLNQIILNLGRQWHCAALNTTNHPIERTFLVGTHETVRLKRPIAIPQGLRYLQAAM